MSLIRELNKYEFYPCFPRDALCKIFLIIFLRFAFVAWDLIILACVCEVMSVATFLLISYIHCRTLDSDSDLDTDSCTIQCFSIGSDSDSDPLIKMYVIGTEICPWDRDPSLKWIQYPLEKGSESAPESVETCSA